LNRALIVLVVGLLVAPPLLTPTPAVAGIEDEAERQLGFARAELDRGEYERAIKSAESALRLEPTLYDAFVIKALAYEGLGNLALAESLLVAYQELRKGLSQHPDVAPALERMRANQESPGAKPRSRTVQVPERVQVQDTSQVAVSTTLDPGPYQDRVALALRAGQCASAQAAAAELTLADPHLSEGFRLKGDAERCSGRNREAVHAYRRYVELGGADPTVIQLMNDLAGTLGTLVVRVHLGDAAVVPLVQLEIPGEEPMLARMEGHGKFVFRDLPVATKAALLVVGRGLDPTHAEVTPLASGQTLEMNLRPRTIGLATIELADHAPGLCNTLLVTPDGSTPISPGQTRTVTAGTVIAVVGNNQGAVEVELLAGPDSAQVFDPVPWLPAELTIVDVPAGSALRVYVEGKDGALVERSFTLPRGRGAIDALTGVRLAPPTPVPSLLGGLGGVFVTHDRLGEGSINVALQAGSPNATTFQWRAMAGVGGVEAEFQAWGRARDAIRRRTGGTVGAGLGLAIGSAAASGVLWGLAVQRGRDGDAARQAAIDAQDACADPQACPELANQAAIRDRAYADETRFVIGGAVTAGTALLGGVLTGVFGAAGKRALTAHGDWGGQ